MRLLRHVRIASLTAAMVVVACAGPDTAPPEPQTWTLAADPDLIIGEDGTPESEFNRVIAALPLPGGELAVVDAADRVIKIFGGTGMYQRSIGRRGSGPGEFQSIGWASLEGDTLVVHDPSQRRVTLMLTDGAVLSTIQPRAEGQPIQPIPRARLDDGTWVVSGTYPHPQAATATAFRDTMFFATMAPHGAGQLRIVERQLSPPIAIIPGTSGGMAPGYFLAWPVAFRIGDRVGVASPYEATFNLYDRSGAPIRQIVLPVPREPITSADLTSLRDAATEGMGERDRALVAARFSAEVTPEAIPAFRSILVDGSDLIWLEEWQHDPLSTPRYHIVDDSGAWRATIALPPRFQPLTIGPDWVLGVHRDEDGVQRVMRFGLTRR